MNSDDGATSEPITTKKTSNKLEAGNLGAQCSVGSHSFHGQVNLVLA